MNSLKPLAMNCGPLSEMIRGRARAAHAEPRLSDLSLRTAALKTTRSTVPSESTLGNTWQQLTLGAVGNAFVQ
jgi:hypothetical protein